MVVGRHEAGSGGRLYARWGGRGTGTGDGEHAGSGIYEDLSLRLPSLGGLLPTGVRVPSLVLLGRADFAPHRAAGRPNRVSRAAAPHSRTGQGARPPLPLFATLTYACVPRMSLRTPFWDALAAGPRARGGDDCVLSQELSVKTSVLRLFGSHSCQLTTRRASYCAQYTLQAHPFRLARRASPSGVLSSVGARGRFNLLVPGRSLEKHRRPL